MRRGKHLPTIASAEWLTYRVQRLLGGGHALAREFTASDVSPVFKVNGSHMPEGEEYAALVEAILPTICLSCGLGASVSRGGGQICAMLASCGRDTPLPSRPPTGMILRQIIGGVSIAGIQLTDRL
jgi:hypothetical protein